MKSGPAQLDADNFPNANALAALRAWYAGLSARQAVQRYLGADCDSNSDVKSVASRRTSPSSRAVLSAIRRQLITRATCRHRPDLAAVLEHPAAERLARAKVVAHTIEAIRTLAPPLPTLADELGLWVPTRAAKSLHAAGLKTLADLAVRAGHRRRWWVHVPGLGATTAQQLSRLLAQQPALRLQASALVVVRPSQAVPWERLVVPPELDGSSGVFRAPVASCTLSARTDVEAVQAWLELHETAATVRAYRKEAERLLLWALLERGKPLSSLTTDDAVAYRAFLRRPSPRQRWVGPSRPRSSPEWRPFQGDLSARSVGYAMSVVSALFRWLVEQRYTLANPFAGIKVKGSQRAGELDTSRALTGHEWTLVRQVAEILEVRAGWTSASAQRLRFVLDFWFATGLRPGELLSATLGNVERKEGGDSWLHVVGKGDKPARVALPTMATAALERYLAQRGLPVSHARWDPWVRLVPTLEDDSLGLSTSRLWVVMRRFFAAAAGELGPVNPALADKLGRASPHWMRHTHASYALAAGAELTTVRDNLRHASISTTSVYLDGDDVKRARQMQEVFPGPVRQSAQRPR